MTETLLALVPTYGPWLIMASVLLSSLALPIPSSVLVMVAGGFAASGDLTLWQVGLAAFAGFVVGDQIAFGIARKGGMPLIARLRGLPRVSIVVARAQALIDRRGIAAVFISHTVASPLGPYVSYLGGALGLRWTGFSLPAVIGAACWSVGYTALGYVFAGQITQIATLVSNLFGVVLAASVALSAGWWLRISWRRYQQTRAALQTS